MVRGNRTGGPKTSEGKKKVSQNALKTGVYSTQVVLPNESSEEFNQLTFQLMHDLIAVDSIEQSFVHDLAVIMWKKMRLENIEQAYFVKKQNEPITMEEFQSCHIDMTQERYVIWKKNKSLTQEEVINYLEQCRHLTPYTSKPISVANLKNTFEKFPDIKNWFYELYQHNFPLHEKLPDLMDLVEIISLDSNQKKKHLTALFFEGWINHTLGEIWCFNHKNKIQEAISKIKQERLWKLMNQNSSGRAFDELSRQFARVMNEYRKHQQWRLDRKLVDISEEAKIPIK